MNDNGIHFRLKNWGRAQRYGMAEAGIPTQHPQGASWAKQIKSDGAWLDLDAPEPIEEDDAEEVQAAIIMCMIHNMPAADVLIKYYRDEWDINYKSVRLARRTILQYI